jgi:hypothetical protein
MGTNIYAWINPCKECGMPQKYIHIGKLSHGWRFALDVSHNCFTNLEAFKLWHNSDMFLVDGAENVWTFNQLLREIKRKKNQKKREGVGIRNDIMCDIINYEFS